MRLRLRRGWRRTTVSPRCRTGICGFLLGASLSLLLVAVPLLAIGGGGSTDGDFAVEPTPLAALGTMPAKSPQFDISALLIGEWTGEVCPDTSDPIPVGLEFTRNAVGEVSYSLAVDSGTALEGIVGDGACDVDGEDLVFHAFLARLNECDDACGVDRMYAGRFEDGFLVGVYSDSANSALCASCVGGGTWWLERVDP